MTYFMTFLEGIISFISPCMLPMLPVYLSYFGGGSPEKKKKVFVSAISFVAGFAVVFTMLGLFAGVMGSFLLRYKTVLNLVCGLIIIVFGLSYLEVIRLPFFKGMQKDGFSGGVISSFLFGVIYSVSLTPCVGVFLGSALMLATTAGKATDGALMLFTYSMGLGIPFIASAVLIDKLKSTFNFIKRHYRIINAVCGIFLIAVGIAMMLGLLDKLLALFS